MNKRVIDELYAMIHKIPGDMDGYTTAELMASLGITASESATRKFRLTIRKALADGILEPCRVTRTNILGFKTAQTGFRFRRPTNKAAKRARK